MLKGDKVYIRVIIKERGGDCSVNSGIPQTNLKWCVIE